MTRDYIIREAGSIDFSAILKIAEAAWEPIFRCFREILGEKLFFDLYPDWRKSKKEELDSITGGKEDGFAYVVEEDGRIIGFITFSIDKSSHIGEIYNNAVLPEYQGQGIGQLMYGYAFKRLKECGMDFVKVVTGGDPSHEPARKAYEKAGFVRKLENVHYYKKL